MTEYEDLQPGHFREWGLGYSPRKFTGFAERQDGKLTAIGFIWFLKGEAWAMFDARPPVRWSVHAKAIELFSGAAEGGLTEILTTLDETKPHARKWLTRLGFIRVPNRLVNEQELWRMQLGVPV